MGNFFGMTVFNWKVICLLIMFIVIAIPLHIFIPKFVNKLDKIRQKNKQAYEDKKRKKREKMLTKIKDNAILPENNSTEIKQDEKIENLEN